MKIHTIKRRQFIARPLSEVFKFFSTPENLALITPPDVGFVVLTPSPIAMKEGTLIDYTILVMGKRQRWTTLISEYAPMHHFVDVQLKGPYSYWHHKHGFIETDDGTIIEDEVRYVMPFGFLGEMLHTLFVEKQLKGIFDHREKIIERLFPGDARNTTVRMEKLN